MIDPCFVKFEIVSADSFDRLSQVVAELAGAKRSGEAREVESWRASFAPGELAAFWSPDEDEMRQWNEFWFSTPLPKRHSPEMPMPPWDFASILDAVLGAEYDLLGVRRVSPTIGHLEFEPDAYPYGGTGALRALIAAFGHRIVGMDDGTGYAEGSFTSPRWTPSLRP
jgi:hypothetical protein